MSLSKLSLGSRWNVPFLFWDKLAFLFLTPRCVLHRTRSSKHMRANRLSGHIVAGQSFRVRKTLAAPASRRPQPRAVQGAVGSLLAPPRSRSKRRQPSLLGKCNVPGQPPFAARGVRWRRTRNRVAENTSKNMLGLTQWTWAMKPTKPNVKSRKGHGSKQSRGHVRA